MTARGISRSCIKLPHPSPAAGAFLHLASRRPLPLLDFLLPRMSLPTSRFSSCYSPRSAPRSMLLLRPVVRTFLTTPSPKATAAIYNRRKDDDGNEMAVEITPRASNRLKEIMAQDENPNLALRITVESGGCHGFQYLMSLTTLPPCSSSGSDAALPSSSSSNNAEIDPDDTVFQALDGTSAKVVMDGPSLELLKGSKIDYTMELIGSQFKIVDNPLATSSCGCGTSFDIKA